MVVPWLTLLFVVPLCGAIVALPLNGVRNRVAGLVASCLTMVLAITVVVLSRFHDLAEQVLWLRRLGAWYALDIDGLSGPLVIAATVLGCAVLAVGFDLEAVADAPTDGPDAPQRGMRPEAFTTMVLAAEACVIAALLSSDLVLFFLFFEASLVPVYLLIGCWGGRKRSVAASRFLIFGLAGGFVLLGGIVGVISIVSETERPNTLLSALSAIDFSPGTERLLFLLFFVAFAIKGPLIPAHSWLPLVAKEANPAVTALVVGMVDGLGGYAMIRFAVGLFPNAAVWAAPGVMILALANIWYAGFAAAGARLLSQFACYTSISHFGFVVLGIFALTSTSVTGSAMYLSAHALSVGALLLVCGLVQQATGTAEIGAFRGLRTQAPVLAGLFLIAGLATLALPGFLNFAAELQVLVGAWERHPVLALFAIIGTLFGAVYVVLVYQRLFTGQPRSESPIGDDVSVPRRVVVGGLLALLLFFGCAPRLLQSYIADAELATVAVAVADATQADEEGE
ncbi:MAG: NADH-quinone oxidoreductase subunit M [Propionibacteriaceae bacterium]|jgi:NADH-quinone oxidoreductase subunit M|nr:NADH-quinone oxidoreductase subunit M [Propionibacteriaceae bacterium]